MIVDQLKQTTPTSAFFDQRLSKPLAVSEITRALDEFLKQDELPYVFLIIREKESGLLRAFSLSKEHIERKATNWFILKLVGQEITPLQQALYDWDQVHSETGVKLNMLDRYSGELFSGKRLPENILLLGNYSRYKVLLIHPYTRKPDFSEQRLPYSDRYWEDKD